MKTVFSLRDILMLACHIPRRFSASLIARIQYIALKPLSNGY